MLTTIQDTVLQSLPARRKKSPSGWISFNAPCCIHNGETADTRFRGGIMPNSNGSLSYHCFNCKFKASYTVGYHLNYKFRKFLSWLGVDENTIKRLVIDAIRVKDIVAPASEEKEAAPEITFKARFLPEDAQNVLESNDAKVLEYLQERKIDPQRYPIYTSQSVEHNLNRRLLVPMYWHKELVGYTARAWDPTVKPKYYSHYEPNFVFNVDKQERDKQFVIVCEGPFDAMSVDGVAILGNECSETQADIIDSLGKEVIVVPDSDVAGAKLIEDAVEYGWTVSFPVWLETCKDINEAVVKYGKLFVLKTILESRETSKLKIELRKRRLYN